MEAFNSIDLLFNSID